MKKVLSLALAALLVISSAGFALAQDVDTTEEPTLDELLNAAGYGAGEGAQVDTLQMVEPARVQHLSTDGAASDGIVVAWEVSRGANMGDHTSLIADLEREGFTVQSIDIRTDGIPAHIDVLVITSFASNGPGNGCLNIGRYTTAEVNQIKGAVAAGMGLFLLNENEFCGYGTAPIAASLAPIGAFGNKWSYTFHANVDYGSNAPSALFQDVASWYLDWATAYLLLPKIGIVARNGANQPAMIAKQHGGGCTVIVGDSNWIADYPFDPNQTPFIDRLDHRTLANRAFGFLENCGLWADPSGPYFGEAGWETFFDGSASLDARGEPITSYVWDFGDGNSGTGATPGHTYADAGIFDVCLTVSTGSGERTDTNCTTADIINTSVPPSLTVDQVEISVPEGETATNTGTVTDGDGDTVALSASTGTVVNNGDGTWSWSFGTTEGPDGPQTVTITADDASGGTAQADFTLTVYNVAPIVHASPDRTVFQHAVVSLDPATFIDPGLMDTHTATIDWGDGTIEDGALDQGAKTVSGSHAYPTPGTYPVTVYVTDDDGDTGMDGFTVNVVHGFLNHCLFANDEELKIEESAHVMCSVAGQDKIDLKKMSNVDGDVIGHLDIQIGERARVGGDARAAGKVKIKNEGSVEGEVENHAQITHVTQVDVSVSACGSDVTVHKGGSLSLGEGCFKLLIVEQDATLTLTAGHYAFEKIEVKKNATLEFVLPDDDQIVIDVADTIDLQEGVVMTAGPGGAARILVRVAGSDVKLGKEGTFLGTFIAPYAHIGQHEGAVLTGALYAKQVQIKKNAIVIGDPALGPFIDHYLH